MYMNIFDSHTHTDNSSDGKHSALYMAEAAEKKEMMGFSVTDHYECGQPEGHYDVRLRNSVMETAKARAAFDKRLLITTGVEIGQPSQDYGNAEKVLGQYKFDFVIGSLHHHKGMDDYYFVDFTDLDTDLILEKYYTEMLELCRWNQFDVLGHLTYPLRYIIGKYHVPVNMGQFQEQIRQIFTILAQNGKGIEINTSGLRQELGETLPPLEYVKLFRECGGEIVTIGSDAYCAQDLGASISDGMALLEAAGFSYFAFYKKREPRLLKII